MVEPYAGNEFGHVWSPRVLGVMCLRRRPASGRGVHGSVAAGSGLRGILVFVVAPHPVHGAAFVAALRRQVEIMVRPDQDVAAARVARVTIGRESWRESGW